MHQSGVARQVRDTKRLHDGGVAVRGYRVISLAALLACGCETTSPELLPARYRLVELSSTRVTASQLTTYSVDPRVDPRDLTGYPTNPWANDGWKRRGWTEEATPSELTSLLDFLASERRKYAHGAEHSEEVERIDNILNDMSGWPVSDLAVSYFYKKRPGTEGFTPEVHWLYVYFLDSDAATITAITNAFR